METALKPRRPWVTLTLFCLTFAVIAWSQSNRPPSPFEVLDAVPTEGARPNYEAYYAFFDFFSLSKARPLALLSAWLLHGSWMHWAVNAFQLVVYGGLYERARGHTAPAVAFFVAHLSGSVLHLLFGNAGPAFGMSAGTWGLIGALSVDSFRSGHSKGQLALRSVLIVLAVAMWFESGAPPATERVHLGGLGMGGLAALTVTWMQKSKARST